MMADSFESHLHLYEFYMNMFWFGEKHEKTFKVEALPLQNAALAGHLLHFTSSYFIVSFLFPLHKT
jgi:hypothetical protein